MKNIHVLPTDKPSKLSINCQTGLLQLGLNNRMFHDDINIYITSDEEIKEGEYGLSKLGEIIKFNSGYDYRYYYEIILTTDQDLIKDGVQSIDDDFLEWFVKNPSCEYIKIDRIAINCSCESQYRYKNGLNIIKENSTCHERNNCDIIYKIIIPSKDDLKIGNNTNFGVITDLNEKSVCFGKNKLGVDVWYKRSSVVLLNRINLDELEQASENFRQTEGNYDIFTKISFEEGAKWQSERMYSEDEVWNIIRMVSGMKESGKSDIEISEYFENNKKK